MTEKEKMIIGKLYDSSDYELTKSTTPTQASGY